MCCYLSFSDNSDRFGKEFKNVDTVVHREMGELVGNSYHWMEGYSWILDSWCNFPRKFESTSQSEPGSAWMFRSKIRASSTELQFDFAAGLGVTDVGGSGTDGFCGS